MRDCHISRHDLRDPATYLRLQRLIVERQAAVEARLGQQPFISDRSGAIDPLAYTAWKYGVHSAQVGPAPADLFPSAAPALCVQSR